MTIGKLFDIEGVLLNVQSPKRDELRAYVTSLEEHIADHVELTEADVRILIAALSWYENEGFGGPELYDLYAKLDLCLEA